jgi:anaerobic selenocysteine-containing dehydrogenase
MRTISRRDFLKLGAASAAVLAIESQLNPIASAAEQLIEGGRSVNRTSGLPRSFLPSTCMQCPAGCGIIGYVEESRLVKIGGNTKNLSNQGALCARGQAGINAVYDPERLLKPMRRVGARGSDSWEEIEWDQALEDVTAALSSLKSAGRQRELVFLTGDRDEDHLGTRFTHAFGSPNAIGALSAFGANKAVANRVTWGAEGDMPDVANSKYILVFGANPLESNPQYVGIARRLINGINNNQAKVVVFDVRLTNTSMMANELHYVNPGTMGLLILTMANVIMQEGLYKRLFIENWTNTTPEELTAHLAQYTPERAEAETGVEAAVIRATATEFATTEPATTFTDASLASHRNGVQNERAAMLLSIITGNIDTRGGLCLPRQFSLAEPDPAPPVPGPSALSNPPQYPLASQQAEAGLFQQIKDREEPVGVLMTHGFNPVYSNPDGGQVEEVLRDETLVPYHVAVTPFFTETAKYADIILPETTYLEDHNIEVRPSPELVPMVGLRQPVVPPLKEARSFYEIATELAARVGGGMERYFSFGSIDEYLSARISGIGGLQKAGGLDYLKQHGAWYDPKSRPDYGFFRQSGFSTPSGKLEVNSQELAAAGVPALPSYQPVTFMNQLSENDMVLSIFDTALQTDAYTANCMWLTEILHDNPVWMNPATAEKLGIQDGDTIKLTRPNNVGDAKERSVMSTAYLTEGIHPKVVAMANGVGHTAFGRIAQAEDIPYKEPPKVLQDPNTELVWWSERGPYEGKGVNPKPIVPIALDPVGGGEAWNDMVVTVAKV